MTQIRIATFNLENFDEPAPNVPHPSLDERIALMKPQITRLRADIACFQEVHGQERPGQPRDLLALKELLVGTNLDGSSLTSTKPANDAVFDVRNLVIATHLPVIKHQQLKNDLVNEPRYQRLTANPRTRRRSRSVSNGPSCTRRSTSTTQPPAGSCTSSTCT
ncbi:hypothetical protein PV726_44110 [Streptomyces europaeiscabiei]|uniref:hypothetical protein n=1 Tax=Streptomyces europaeiscabiei TaxID=146819 RepID=UPI0029AFA7B4|nr:hypothetical protein [Streptomyces europaeiscabiei]MDX3697094.1 hypothetical protein [Streptomyces europaeiscabiei]